MQLHVDEIVICLLAGCINTAFCPMYSAGTALGTLINSIKEGDNPTVFDLFLKLILVSLNRF